MTVIFAPNQCSIFFKSDLSIIAFCFVCIVTPCSDNCHFIFILFRFHFFFAT